LHPVGAGCFEVAMQDALTSFRKREQSLRRKHVRMSQGYVTRMTRNGLIEQVPDNKLGGVGLKIVVRLVLVMVAFKVLTLAWIGDVAYAGHLEALTQGAAHEKAGAWLMQIDPATRMLADLISPLLG
jgi:hypothetical protein